MKKVLFILFACLVLNSCSTINRVIEVDDQYKEIKSIKLRQQPSAYSIEKNGHFGGRSSYNLTANLNSEIKSGIKPESKIDFQFITGIRSDELDSVMYLVLDQEKIKLASANYKYKQFDKSSTSSTVTTTTSVEKKPAEKNSTSTKPTENVKTDTTQTTTVENGTYQLMSREFIVPENLWVSIIHSKTILYRLYIGREGIDVELTDSEMNKVREFFSRVVQQRDAMFPTIPEGQMKW